MNQKLLPIASIYAIKALTLIKYIWIKQVIIRPKEWIVLQEEVDGTQPLLLSTILAQMGQRNLMIKHLFVLIKLPADFPQHQ